MDKVTSGRLKAFSKAARAIMEATGAKPGPENYERYLDELLARVNAGGPAFLALDALLFAWAKYLCLDVEGSEELKAWEGVDPKTPIPIPWWVISTIVAAYSRFKNPDPEEGKRPTLGRAFEVEQKGQGNRPLPVVERDKMRDFQRALLIASEYRRLGKVDAALRSIETVHGFARSLLMDNWSEHGKKALAALRTSPTSRG